MKLRHLISCSAVAVFFGGFVSNSRAALLLYEGFSYAAGQNLNGQTGGTGFDGSSSWNAVATSTNGSGFVAIQPSGSTSGVILNDGATPNPFNATYANLPSTGNYAGTNDGGSTYTSLAPGVADHLYMWRKLDSTVTSSFTNGSTTWFSFVSARAYNANARAPSLLIGAGILDYNTGEQRGETVIAGTGNTSKQGIAVGGITDAAGNVTGTINGSPATIGGVSLFRAQYFSSTGTRTYVTGTAGAVGGAALSSTTGTVPLPGDNGYWMQGGKGTAAYSIPYGYSDANIPSTTKALGDNESHVNITVGSIQWGAGANGEDIVSFYVFHDKDSLVESAFSSGALSWTTPEASSDRSQFNYLSIGGGRFFVDEVRIATTFNEALGLAPVPEPSAVLLALLGLGALIRRRRN